MAPSGHTLGVDFGTSNSAAAYLQDGKPCLVEMTPGRTSMPTTFFFDFESKQILMGEAANLAQLEGAEGRFMRALKRVLGTALMHEQRQILSERITFVDIIGRYLAAIKQRAEDQSGMVFDSVLSGRPVVFHGQGDEREAQAEDDLRACYRAAGFRNVSFMAEPEAAAIASGAERVSNGVGLIVDIGGGTSDFSLFRTEGSSIRILANHGVRVGGTDFDRAISLDRVMPLLGKGTSIRKTMGPGLLTAPNGIFNDLATWERIPFLYTTKVREAVSDTLRLSEEPSKLKRLQAAIVDELGHEIAFAVEHGKIAANGDAQSAEIALDALERGLHVPISASIMRAILDPYARALTGGVRDTVRLAGIDTQAVDRVVYVGGSSLMAIVPDTMALLFPNAEHSFSDVFTAVTDGLALATARAPALAA